MTQVPACWAPATRAPLVWVICLLGVGGSGTIYAQPDQETPPFPAPALEAGVLTGRPIVRPPRLERPPVIDGQLDDAAWSSAAHITDLVQRRPFDGVPASEASDTYLAYDNSNIYVGLHAHYEEPSIMRANRRDRDQSVEDDLFPVYFDPFLDQQRAYVFTVNGYGVQGDAILQAGALGGGRFGVPRGDASWDVLFDAAGDIVDDGFLAEMAIPFKSLRYPPREAGAPHRWGLQIARTIGGKDEAVVWSPTSRDIAGFLPQMGVLDGMTDLSRSHNIELLPTFTAIRFGSLDPATGQFHDKDPSPEGGVNLKYGVTSNLTADFTLNPDFSQIESDLPQIEVNQRFVLFYPELRPFFLEGAEIFSIPTPITAVHTRTIVDPFYGAKLTGKVGRAAVGVMYANDEVPGAVDDVTAPLFEQAAGTFVGRVRYDLYAESHIGTIFTDRELLDGHSRLAGVDANFRMGDTHAVAFRAMGTDHRDLEGLERNGYLLDAEFRNAAATSDTRSAHMRYRRTSRPTSGLSGGPTSGHCRGRAGIDGGQRAGSETGGLSSSSVGSTTFKARFRRNRPTWVSTSPLPGTSSSPGMSGGNASASRRSTSPRLARASSGGWTRVGASACPSSSDVGNRSSSTQPTPTLETSAGSPRPSTSARSRGYTRRSPSRQTASLIHAVAAKKCSTSRSIVHSPTSSSRGGCGSATSASTTHWTTRSISTCSSPTGSTRARSSTSAAMTTTDRST